MQILALSGNLRRGSYNTAALDALSLVAPVSVEVRLFDGLGELPLFNPDLESEFIPAGDQLPAGATWDDVIYSLVGHREIELGLADSEAGRTAPIEDVMKEFGIEP